MDEQNRHYRFFQNRQCECFPCHRGVAEEDFNCLFCFCPLYALGRRCGGDYRYDDRGCKDCANCAFPHQRDNYDNVIARYHDILTVVARMDENETPGEG